MARPGVNLVDVSKAAEAIQQEGFEPTVDRVREYIGSGSKSTISPLLKQWKNRNTGTAQLPAELIEVVRTLHQRLQNDADERVVRAQEEFEQQKAELDASLAQSNKLIADKTASMEALDTRYRALSEQNTLREQQLQTQALELAKGNTLIEQLQAQLTEKSDVIKSMKQENQAVRMQFEHFQQQTAEERRQEREQVADTQLQFTRQLNQYENRLKEAELQRQASESIAAEQRSSLEQANRTIASQKEQLEITDQQNSALKKANTLLTEEREKLQSDRQSRAELQGRLREKVNALTVQLEHRDKLNAKLETKLNALTQEVHTLNQDKLELVQKCASLQGRL